jgi:hypothetical protein
MDFQPYVYASNNPVNQTDPSGMWSPRVLFDGEYAAPLAPIKPAPSGMNPTKPTQPRCWIPEVCNHGHRNTDGNGSGGRGKTPQTQSDYGGEGVIPHGGGGDWDQPTQKQLNAEQVLANGAVKLLAFSAMFAAAAAALYAFSGWAAGQGAELEGAAAVLTLAAFFDGGASLPEAIITAVLGGVLIGLSVLAKQMAANFAIAATDAILLGDILAGAAASGGWLTKGGLDFLKGPVEWVNGVLLTIAGSYVNFKGKGGLKFIQVAVSAVVGGGWALPIAPDIAFGAIQHAENVLG